MVITFLGTAAANAYPLAFCRCGNCERARELGGPSLRRRSSALINDDLLIDLGPDIITGSFLAGCSLASVRYCLQTHSHADHLDPSHFEPRTSRWAVVGVPRLHFYASAATARRIAAQYEGFYDPVNLFDQEVAERLNLEIHQMEALQSFAVGSYRVTAFPANHDPAVEPLVFAVEGQGRSIFYGVDTAALTEETWRGFHQHNLRFDMVILDHTYGSGVPGTDHLSADQFIEHIARMREEGLLTHAARAFATHISHEGNPPHPELAEFAARHGYEIAYDGLAV
jgi:phosphoribosyl 1,2-cyclic phosphate phosphodiesterase